jgi:excinuclease ABC subunit C
VLDKNEKWPTIKIVRAKELDNYKNDRVIIFGPYQSYRLLDNALRIIRRVFPYSACKPGAGKPCFNRQIGLCPGVCTAEISHNDYLKNIKHLELFLSGNKKRLLKVLMKDNPDKIKALKHIQDVSLLHRKDSKSFPFSRIEAYDISHLSGKEVYGSMTVMTDGEIDKKEYRLFKISQQENNDFAALKEVLSRRFKHKEWPNPDLILIDGGSPQLRELEKLAINIKMVGLSKVAGDKLVFRGKSDKILESKIIGIKLNLQELRDEAHRFVVLAGRRARKIKF